MSKPDSTAIARLPKWAQDHIQGLGRERDAAIKALNEFCDGQTESPVSVVDIVSSGEQQGPSFKYHYIQTRQVQFDWAGVRLTVLLRDGAIDLQWYQTARHSGDVCMQPRSYQQVYLIAKDAMR